MQRYLFIGLFSLWLVSVWGCTSWPSEEYDARLESAENNAASARLRAGEVCARIDLVEQTANEALRRANEALDKVHQLQQQAKRK